MGELKVATISSNNARVELGTESIWFRPKSLGSLSGTLVAAEVADSGFRGVSDDLVCGLDVRC
jgi:hypothetical protein